MTFTPDASLVIDETRGLLLPPGLPLVRVASEAGHRDLYQLQHRLSYIWYMPYAAAEGGRPELPRRLMRLELREGFLFDGSSHPAVSRIVLGGTWALGIAPVAYHDGLFYAGGCLQPRCNPWVQLWSTPLPSQLPLLADELSQLSWQPAEEHLLQWTRDQCDRFMLRLCREQQIASWRRKLAYQGLRLGSLGPYQRARRLHCICSARQSAILTEETAT